MLEKGQGYFSNYYLFFPGAAYGLTDRLTVGGGMSVFPGVGFDEQMYYIAPKVGLKNTEKFNLAAGALLIRIPDF